MAAPIDDDVHLLNTVASSARAQMMSMATMVAHERSYYADHNKTLDAFVRLGKAAIIEDADVAQGLGSPRVLLDLFPSVMFGAVVTLGGSTSEGAIVDAVATPWFDIIREVLRNPSTAHEIGWRKWEEIIAGSHKAAGFDVILTPRSGDKGRDVIATRTDFGSIRIIDQVKAYSPARLVPADDVRALVGVLEMERNVSKGVITTTSDFAPGVYTDPRIQELTPNRLELRPRDKLIEWLAQACERRTPR